MIQKCCNRFHWMSFLAFSWVVSDEMSWKLVLLFRYFGNCVHLYVTYRYFRKLLLKGWSPRESKNLERFSFKRKRIWEPLAESNIGTQILSDSDNSCFQILVHLIEILSIVTFKSFSMTWTLTGRFIYALNKFTSTKFAQWVEWRHNNQLILHLDNKLIIWVKIFF